MLPPIRYVGLSSTGITYKSGSASASFGGSFQSGSSNYDSYKDRDSREDKNDYESFQKSRRGVKSDEQGFTSKNSFSRYGRFYVNPVHFSDAMFVTDFGYISLWKFYFPDEDASLLLFTCFCFCLRLILCALFLMLSNLALHSCSVNFNSECAARTMIIYPVEKGHPTLPNIVHMCLQLLQTTMTILMILIHVELPAIVCFFLQLLSLQIVYHSLEK